MNDQGQTRTLFGVATIDKQVGTKVMHKWFDDVQSAEEEVARLGRLGVAAVIETASGIGGWTSP
jgi:hypothetical protein